MGRFNASVRAVGDGASGRAQIALHRCVEAHARASGQRFCDLFDRLAWAHGFGREPTAWSGPEQIRAALADLVAEREAWLRDLDARVAARRAAKANGRRGCDDPVLWATAEARRAIGIPRVGVFGWRARRAPVPPIGSEGWDQELAALGIERAWVDELLALALAAARFPGDAHGLELSPWRLLFDADVLGVEVSPELQRAAASERSTLALSAAAWLLYHEAHPGYAALMYWRFVFQKAREAGFEALMAWFARQLAAMLRHGRPEVVESAAYVLDVDFLEDARDARDVLLALADQMGEDWRFAFLERSASVDWAAKRGLYRRLARDPSRHVALARAIERSVWGGFFGAVDASEASELLSRLDLDDALRASAASALSAPIGAWIGAVVALRARPRPPPRQREGDHLVGLALESLPTWIPGSELWLGPSRGGRIACVWPAREPAVPCERSAIRARTDASGGPPQGYDARIRWFVLRSAPGAELSAWVGREVRIVPGRSAPGTRAAR